MMTKISQQDIGRITKSIIDQATAFLKDTGEFYPFGTAIDKAGDLRPIGIYLGVEHPDSTDVIERLAEALWDGIVRGQYQMVGMGIDVYIQHDSIEGKTSAIEIRVVNEDGLVVRYYQPYKLTSSNHCSNFHHFLHS